MNLFCISYSIYLFSNEIEQVLYQIVWVLKGIKCAEDSFQMIAGSAPDGG
jgi:hypothetical protein